MYRPNAFYDEDPMGMYQRAMMSRGGRARRFDEYYRCYPVAMMPGPERDAANHGGKIFLPASALDKLTTLHISYPMLFELINGSVTNEDGQPKKTHSGVLEFIAEEGRCYLPFWLMQILSIEPGDLLQVKSTDLSPGNFIKLQPQSPDFLDISDPKAVLENVFRSYSCLTVGDVFTFSYNDHVYEIAVLEVKPDDGVKRAISVQETDLSVDFATPVGYKEPERVSGTSTPRSVGGMGGVMHGGQGTMAQSINYDSIKPSSSQAATGHAYAASHFTTAGHRLVAKKGGSKTASPAPGTPVSSGTPVAGQSVNIGPSAKTSSKRRNGPQPLRLPPNKLFFGYEIKPKPSKKDENAEQKESVHFSGEGQTLRKKKGDGK
ncbi:hypothetical protein AAFC00_003485 [Neodothiora populina]|uniref:Ubiquitin fusion degradation protein n=1 Tax=Neodothiora populina TaxID=2781224 RepID=A0ABR3PEE3_9PEZI